MWRPFRRTEKQAAEDLDSYTNQIINAELHRASGNAVSADDLAVAEACVGLWERALASASVEPMNNRLAALTPALLALAGRSLAISGNLALAIIVEGAEVKLLPAAHFDAFGSADPASWLYHLTLTGPSDS